MRRQPVLKGYGLGCNLIFGGIRPFVDSRADPYGDAFLARFNRIIGLNIPELRHVLAEYRVAWTVFPADDSPLFVTDDMPGWQRRLEAAGIVVHARTDAPH